MRRLKRSELNDAEGNRLDEDVDRQSNWKRWGPYLAERQWATVREDYSASGDTWGYFPHDHARSRVYRWGEDGLLGITDRQCRLCFAFALWNEKDPILKERLYGLTGPEGNHGEDVKELYYYLDALPTYAYAKALYKYPQSEFPYAELIRQNQRRGLEDPEFEILDTAAFREGRYFDVLVEYAKDLAQDICIKVTVSNRGPDRARLHLLPTMWFRNTWAWNRTGEGYWPKPTIGLGETPSGIARVLWSEHTSLGHVELAGDFAPDGSTPEAYFTENETNRRRLWGAPNQTPYVKDAFHARVIGGETRATNPENVGTKAALHYVLDLGPGESQVVKMRLYSSVDRQAGARGAFEPSFEKVFDLRKHECDEFHRLRTPFKPSPDEDRIIRQGRAGLLFSKQFYWYVVKDWLEGDPANPPPPASRSRNKDWNHLYNRDVISMPDKWEYPWYAAWDLAFHMIPMAEMDPAFAKDQLILFLREWYMHPNGQLPAYEFNFGDVNPPVFAWACWRVYKMSAPKGKRDRTFLARCFSKLLLNFTWWVNRKDETGNHIFSGGFLGLDNIGVFDRSKPLPMGGHLAQADGTAWMAFFAAHMLAMAFELAVEDPAAEDVASKFFEHFVAIADAINSLGGTGLWDEQDGFYYDQVQFEGRSVPLRVRSIVGLIPLFTAEVLEEETLAKMPAFTRRMEWLLENRPDLARHISWMQSHGDHSPASRMPGEPAPGLLRLLAIPSQERLRRALRHVLSEDEFLSPYGIRSLSLHHKENPYVLEIGGEEYRVDYAPGDSTTRMFGGNSNWRGPIWFPINFLLIEALERYHYFYGDSFEVECPTGSGNMKNLREVARDIERRLTSIFLPGEDGSIPCFGERGREFADDPNFKELLHFHEYFHADNGSGLGADHQTGWTALVVRCLEKLRTEGP
jgi:hypothetical protein